LEIQVGENKNINLYGKVSKPTQVQMRYWIFKRQTRVLISALLTACIL